MRSLLERARRWHQRWHALLPILVVEFIVLLGFGALLPILPFYVVEHGIDIQTLGLITAAWGLSKLVSEPIFGFIADHTSRKPLMILGLAFLGVFTILPLVFTSAAALFVLRLLSGAAAGAYDPPARGIIVDSTPEGERGEAFGLYSAAQMGGFLVGPIIGAVGASLGGGYAFPFLLTGGLALLSAVYLAVALPSHRTGIAQAPAPVAASAGAEQAVELALEPDPEPRAPLRALADRLLIAAVLMNFGFAFSAGIYEVIWSLFMDSLGASIQFIGLTFALFGLPVLVLSAYAGRVVDRHGGLRFAVAGGLVIAACGIAYSLTWEPVIPALFGLIEGTAFAFTGPALYAMLASASPPGRTATAQGIFGASTQLAIVLGSVAAGYLWVADQDYPFWFFFVVATISALGGWLIARGARPVRRTVSVVTAALVTVALLAACAAPLPATDPPSPTTAGSPAAPSSSVTTPSPSSPAAPTLCCKTSPTPPESAAPTTVTYVVQPGDSISSIAEMFGLTVDQLLAANPQITDPDHIEVGAALTIPPPDAPITVPFADAIDDPTGDLSDDADQAVFAPGYVDLTALEARLDSETLFIELLMVADPPAVDPDVEQLDYSVYVDVDADDQADFQLRASNTIASLDPEQAYAATITDLAAGTTSSPDDFPGVFSIGDTIRFEVFRSVFGPTRRYGVATIAVRRFYPGGVGDPEVEAALDRVPEQAWPRVNAQWLEVGL